MRVEVKVLDDEWTSAPAIFKDLRRCLTLPAALRCRVQRDAAGHRGRRGDPLYLVCNLLRASRPRLSPPNKNASVRPSWQMRRISASLSPTTAPSRCVMSSIKTHPPRPTPGRLSRRAPTNVSHTRNCSTGPDPVQLEGLARCLLRHRWRQQCTAPKPSTESLNWADALPEVNATPPTTDAECFSSPQAETPPPHQTMKISLTPVRRCIWLTLLSA